MFFDVWWEKFDFVLGLVYVFKVCVNISCYGISVGYMWKNRVLIILNYDYWVNWIGKESFKRE